MMLKCKEQTTNCKSVLHLNSLKYCDEQKQIAMLSSRIEHNVLHKDIDEEVKQLVDEAVKNKQFNSAVCIR